MWDSAAPCQLSVRATRRLTISSRPPHRPTPPPPPDPLTPPTVSLLNFNPLLVALYSVILWKLEGDFGLKDPDPRLSKPLSNPCKPLAPEQNPRLRLPMLYKHPPFPRSHVSPLVPSLPPFSSPSSPLRVPSCIWYREGIAMRMSCNGCRVLRKGCSDSCTIRPCLQWIKSPEAQANATVFLAKFYGRAGLMNLINAGPDHLRPAIFRSLLYEACGRIVNPIYGSVGLLWSGNWPLCQAAVENVLRGAPVIQISSDSAAAAVPPSKAYDIRHVVKNTDAAAELHKVAQPRPRFKRLGHVIKPKAMPGFLAPEPGVGDPAVVLAGSTSAGEPPANMGESRENGSVFSVESVDGSHVSQAEPHESGAEAEAVGLDLTLGLWPAEDRQVEVATPGGDACRVVGLGFGLLP